MRPDCTTERRAAALTALAHAEGASSAFDAAFFARFRDALGRSGYSEEHFAAAALIGGIVRSRLPLDLAAKWAQGFDVDAHEGDDEECLAHILGDGIAERLFGVFGVHVEWNGVDFVVGSNDHPETFVLTDEDIDHLNAI